MADNDKKNETKNEAIQTVADTFDAHRQLVVWLFLSTISITVIVVVVLLFVDQGKDGSEKISILPLVAISGMLGSFVSALNRLYSFQNIFPYQKYEGLFKKTNFYFLAYSSIPPLVGAIAAVMLYVIFASGLLSGALFPLFVCEIGEKECDQFSEFLKFWKPAFAPDYAKTLVWGFISGFSERFVPDILNRLSEKS